MKKIFIVVRCCSYDENPEPSAFTTREAARRFLKVVADDLVEGAKEMGDYEDLRTAVSITEDSFFIPMNSVDYDSGEIYEVELNDENE